MGTWNGKNLCCISSGHALREYPNIKSADELLDVTFQKGIIPIVRDEHIKRGSINHQAARLE